MKWLQTVLRVWDCLFNEGSKILFRVALTLIGLHRTEILSTTQFSELSDCLKKIVKSSTVLNCHTFMQNIFKVPGKITSKNLKKIRDKVAKERKDKKKEN